MPERPMEGECESVQLEPFVHQVGGHYGMLCLDDATVCKPLSPREHHFYETMPPDMQAYVPHYRGVIEVTFQEDSEGRVTMVAVPPDRRRRKKPVGPSDSPTSSGEGAQSGSDGEEGDEGEPSTSANTRCNASGHRVRCPGGRGSGRGVAPGGRGVGRQLFEEAASETARWQLNPWSAHCYKEQLARMRRKSSQTGPHKFLLLENLASHFELPCILDLKMGTRMHGDDATDEKRHNQMRKCEETTSAGLGVRMCGMQVYQADTGRFLCHNKYYGRQLGAAALRQTLRRFLRPRGARGATSPPPLVDAILRQLRALHATLTRQHTFRFYSSSLLIMYDGADWCAEPPPGGAGGGSADGGWERGEAEEEAGQEKGRPSVYMIDFAHTTHHGFRGDRTQHAGPDRGYLFGLENLIQMLVDVQQDGDDE